MTSLYLTIRQETYPLLFSQSPKLLSGIDTYCARAVDNEIQIQHISRKREKVEFIVDEFITLKVKNNIN